MRERERERERERLRERERERERDSVCLNCVCFTELVVWINPLIAVSLKTRLLEGYCKCMCPLGTAFLMPPGWRLHRLGHDHRCLQLYFNFVSFTFLCCDDIEYILDTNCVLHTKLYVINIISTFYKHVREYFEVSWKAEIVRK